MSVCYAFKDQILNQRRLKISSYIPYAAVSVLETSELLMPYRLLYSGDFDECVMSCRRLTSGREIGLYSATTTSPKHSPSTRSQWQLPWQFCVTAVRDSFPPDPVFRGGGFSLPIYSATSVFDDSQFYSFL